MATRFAAAGLAAFLALTAGCTTLQQLSSDVSTGFRSRVTRPVRYRLAGADPELRRNIERGRAELRARNYRAAVAALNRAVWDVEWIDGRALRLAELGDVYAALGDAHAALGNAAMADDHRRMARALVDAGRRPRFTSSAQILPRAKDAYLSAHFRRAVKALREALVDLEDLLDADIRIMQLAETRCYLAFSYFAGQQHDRVRDELRRLWAHDPSMGTCAREAPPGLRPVIADVQRRKDS